jgi:hypothetical protein
MSRSSVIVVAIAASLFGGVAAAQDTQPQSPPAENQQPQDSQQQNPQPTEDPVAGVVGAWELSNADHDKTCRLNFRADLVTNGHKVDVDKNCPNVFPSTKDIAAWTVDNYGSLRLLNTQGDAVIELTAVESGMYDGFTPEEGRYILQAAAAAAANATRTADDVVGDWAVVRSTGKPICVLSLANTTVAGGDNLALKVKPGCDAMILRFGPVSWRMDNGELVLQPAKGQIWRFEENDANTWQRLPESADPILLVRQ